jgi:hypothetical protein
LTANVTCSGGGVGASVADAWDAWDALDALGLCD